MFEKENVLKALSETLDKMETEKEKSDVSKGESDYGFLFALLFLTMIFCGNCPTDHTEETYLKGKVDAYENVIGRMF